MEKGLIHIYTGDGKGKTTAAVGLCYRASLSGYKVGFTSFMKDFSSGECLCDNLFTIFKSTPFEGFLPQMSQPEIDEAKKAANTHLKEIFNIALTEHYDLIVLDEVLVAAKCGIVDKELLAALLENKPDFLEVVMTGRDCPEELFECGDYISEIKAVRHPYEKGICARKGIEF